MLYGALGLLEGANVSVGRGTDEPFERLGAPWIDGVALADALRARPDRGARLHADRVRAGRGGRSPASCAGGVHVALADARAFRPVEGGGSRWAGSSIASSARPSTRRGVDARLASHATWERWLATSDPARLAEGWKESLEAFEALRAAVLLYE